MDMKLRHKKTKVALVTGGSRGIGKSVCLKLAEEGKIIICVGKTQKSLNILNKELNQINGLKNQAICIDLMKKKSVEKLFKILKSKNIKLDIVVNNLGGSLNYRDPLGPLDEWKNVMRLNVEIAIEINRLAIPNMKKQNWGRICHLSSVVGIENQGSPSYCASKSALNAYVRSVGRYVAKNNIIMTSVMPGAIMSEGNYWDIARKKRPLHYKKFINERMAIKRFGKVEEISSIVQFLCSDKASFCVGSCFLVDGGQGKSFYPHEFS